jgi:hypothetical protein
LRPKDPDFVFQIQHTLSNTTSEPPRNVTETLASKKRGLKSAV